MIDDLSTLARHLLGPLVTVAVDRVSDLQQSLLPEEERDIARAVPSRRADFVAGRTAARQLLARIGLPQQAIPKGVRGAPVWPDGLVGSLTHGGGVCVAAIARSDNVRSIGIDLEPIAPLDPPLVNEICSQAERDWITTQPDAADLPLRIFSAKEAVYKALYPITGLVMDFAALDVRISRDRAGFTACLNGPHRAFLSGTSFSGGQGTVNGYVFSVIRLKVNHL